MEKGWISFGHYIDIITVHRSKLVKGFAWMRLLKCHVLKHSQSVLIRNQTYRQNEIFKSRLKRKEEENGSSLSGIRTRVFRSPSRQMIYKNSKVVWPVGRAPRPLGGRSCSCGRSTWGCIPRPELTMTSLSVFVKSIRIILFCFVFILL